MKARLSFTSFSLALLFAFATGDRLYAQDDWDFGDAPDPTYPTLLANNGARHLAGQLRMGLNIDTEADGQPTAAANGDDINPSTADDEDGVTFNTALISGVPGSVTVQCNGLSGSEYLQAWIDFNVDGDWDDPGEQIITDYPPISGPNLVNFPVPAFAFPGGTATTYARFRLSSQPGLSYTNMASYGEVEDYMVTLYPLKWLQEPDLTETGVDVDTDVELADDFHCIQTGPITDIHIWGSYKGDTPTHSLDPAQLNNLTFVLKIWSDIPANPPGGVPYSHPGNLEWQGMFGPGQYQAGLVALIEEGEWWHSPQMDPPDDWIYPGDYHCYQYDFYIDPTNAFPQVESNVYWLGVQVLNNTGDYPFGWKSSTNHFNDDAVWWDNTQGQWRELLYGDGHPFATLPYPENSMDLSFAVSTEEEEEYDHKMHWPQLPDPNGWDVLACYHEEMGMQKVLADDFRCMRDGPISHITFWGSWSFDEFEEQDYYQGITNIHLSLHKDIPDPDGQGPLYSMPVVPAEWEWDINPTNLPPGWDLLVTPEIPSWQGWYDPNMDQYMENNHTNYFRYDVWIPADEAFVQTSNTIYWLDISVETIFGQWGWKTSRSEHFMDDAVWADLPVRNTNQWNELRDPTTGESLDLAFIIDGEEPQDELDWGDCFDAVGALAYNTLLANNGANHVIVPTVFLGASIDAEPDGQPDVLALGDDNDLFYPSLGDDEDGIVFKSALIAGMNASFDVTASLPGWLDVWLDVDNSGTWTAPDLVFGGNIPGGTSTQNFGVPAGVASGINYMRFRFNAGGVALPPSGSAQDGEVEDYIVQIGELDWGDAPDVAGGPGFETLGFNNGANHLIIPNLFMGNLVDAEPDGQPTAQADGDDLDVLYPSMGDDEDGVVFLTPLIPGVMAQVNVTVTPGGGWLAIWLDSDQSGTWAPVAERVFLGNVVGGVNTINFVVPAGTLLGPNYMRFRLTQSLLASYPGGGGPVPYGPAIDGEVEDYQVWVIEEADWGDAPDALMPPQYPTLAVNNGAFHAMSITPGMFLGAGIDSDPDGQPTPGAIGDDLLDGNDDEDGLVSVSHLAPGQPAVIKVVASLPGFLDAWLDYNANGNWADPLDQILASHALNPGTNTINIVVPPGAVSTNSTYVRLRYGSAGGLPPTGQALDGEVEDYKVRIEEAWLDWGDAPDPNYPTLSTSSGAAHLIVTNGPAIGPILGAIADLDADGQPNASATGDDGDGSDDEDGVTFKSKVVAGTNVTVEVVVGVAAGKLDAWVDFNDDGDWADGSEQIFNSQAVGTGTNNLNFAVPQPSALGGTIARFRISSSGGLSYDNSGLGYIPDGEVEDYAVDLYQPQPSTNIVITNLFFSASNAVAQVEWNSESNITYQLQSSTNLMTNVWVDVEATVLGPVYWQTNNMSAETTKFYRVTVPWTP